jgi:hypothetical protein
MERKRTYFLLLSTLAVTALTCSTSDLIALLVTPTPSPLPVIPPTETKIELPTITPTTYTPTFTLTPTLIGWNPTDTPTVTGTPPPTETLQATPTLEENIILLPETSGFQSVLLSQEAIYYGSDCLFPAQTEVRARVTDPDRVGLVSFFLRMRNKATGNDSGWDIGTTMTPAGNGLYALLLNANDLHADDRYAYYTDAWIEFQLIVFDKRVREIGRTDKLVDRLTLAKCP